MNRRLVTIIALGAMTPIAVLATLADHQDSPAKPKSETQSTSHTMATPAHETVSVPPTSPSALATTVTSPKGDGQAIQDIAHRDPIGVVKPIASTTNASTALVAEALTTGTHPERLSALVQPPPFDARAFAAATVQERAAYIDDVQPGRALQSAAPGDQVPVLSPLGPTQLTIAQDAIAYLRVRTVPNGPATFTTFDLGRFQNQLTSQTVLADADGVAAVGYTPGPGTIDAVHVLAASPLASGQVLFDILVTDPVTAQATRPAGN